MKVKIHWARLVVCIILFAILGWTILYINSFMAASIGAEIVTAQLDDSASGKANMDLYSNMRTWYPIISSIVIMIYVWFSIKISVVIKKKK